MIVITQGYEPKWLVIAKGELFLRSQHFGHALHSTGRSLKGNFDKIALAQRIVQGNHSTG